MGADYQVRRISPDELERLTELCHYNNTKEMIRTNRADLLSGKIDIFVLSENGRLIGELRVKYISGDSLQTIPGKRVYLYAFRVLKAKTGKGLGTMLLTGVLAQLESAGYTQFTKGVEDRNAIALHMYRKQGFSTLLDWRYEEYQGDGYVYNLFLRDISLLCGKE